MKCGWHNRPTAPWAKVLLPGLFQADPYISYGPVTFSYLSSLPDMYGPDIFAVLTAHDQKNKAGSAFELKHNMKWFRQATCNVHASGSISLEH